MRFQFSFKLTDCKYENGEILPNASDISLICKTLEIYEADLFGNGNIVRTTQADKSRNPFGTNAKCEPSLRKCYFSKKDIEFTKEMFEELKLDENEKEILEK